jgi:hypothetical protein
MRVLGYVAVGIFLTPWVAYAGSHVDDVTATQSAYAEPLPETPKPLPVATSHSPAEDDADWDCARNGNRICGPKSGHPAGCYRDGVLIIPWTNYADPKSDPLYGQMESPC